MKKIFKIISLSLSSILLFGTLAACGAKPKSDAVTLTFYRGYDTGMVDGSEDPVVKKAIEEKFLADTGIKINLVTKLYMGDDFTSTVNMTWTKRTSDIDAVVDHIAEGGMLLSYTKEKDTVVDYGPILEEYGQNILKYVRMDDTDHIAERSAYVEIDGEYKMNMIPSVYSEKGYSMIIRKDVWRDLYQSGKVALNPDDYDVMSTDYKNLSLEEFNSILYAMKEVNSIKYPFMGYPWDVQRVLGPLFDLPFYNALHLADGSYAPFQFSAKFGDYLDMLWTWARDGIWEKESTTITDEVRLQYFLTGQSAVYITYPEISNLISAARGLKAFNSDAEVMMLAPFKDGEGTVKGYNKFEKSFAGVFSPTKTENAELVVKFIDWLYSDVENYELAAYGIKGTHWVEGEDFTLGEKTYKTWAYPASKEEQYTEQPPYSGCYLVLRNVNVSNRIREDYNNMEKRWYALATDIFPVFKEEGSAEGIWYADAPRSMTYGATKLDNDFVSNVRNIAWSGTGKTVPSELLTSYISAMYADNAVSTYLTFINDSVQKNLTGLMAKLNGAGE